MADYERRMRACLWALACGDALGQLTEGYWPHWIPRVYGGAVRDFAEPVRPHDPLEWREGEVSDDTLMTLLLARSLVAHEGRFDADDFAARITERPIKGWPRWAAFARAREAGDAAAATDSAGPGAAVRSVAIGLIDRPDDLDLLVLDAVAAARVTHRRRPAVAAAAAVAAAVSAAIEGADRDDILEVAVTAAARARDEGDPAGDGPDPDIAVTLETLRLTLGGRAAGSLALGELGAILRSRVEPGFRAAEAVPFALVLAYATGDAGRAILEAVNQGGDADSVAAIAGAVAAAMAPETLPAAWVERVRRANPTLDVDELVPALARLR